MTKRMTTRHKRIGAPSGSRALNASETRERILQAGVNQFALHGFTGASVSNICKDADVTARMVYHYFRDKAGLYVAVLEYALERLRTEELKLDVSNCVPMEGLLTMFDFMFSHFTDYPELIRLLSAENLLHAKFLKSSAATPMMASPVIQHIRELIRRGEESQEIRAGIDPLHLYVAMVALCYFHKSNAYTLSAIFDSEILSQDWRERHHQVARQMLTSYLAP